MIIRVVLVDDHPLYRAGVGQRLSEHDGSILIVGEAGSAREALDMVTRLAPDVVLMDIAIGDENGIDATREIKSVLPGTAVIILSMYDDIRYVEAAVEAGAAGYFLKTVQGPALAAAIHQAYEGDAVLSPEIAGRIFHRLAPRSHNSRGTASIQDLTPRESEVLALVSRGAANKEIARSLDLSVRTVEAHLRSIYQKLQVLSRTEAALAGLREGIVPLEQMVRPDRSRD